MGQVGRERQPDPTLELYPYAEGRLAQLVRTKGRIQAILHANLIPKYDGHLFGPKGRKWLAQLPLAPEERALLGRYVDELERVSAQLAELD